MPSWNRWRTVLYAFGGAALVLGTAYFSGGACGGGGGGHYETDLKLAAK